MTRWVRPLDGHEFTLDEMKRYIGGGYIEVVHLEGGEVMVIDEEGKNKQLPKNDLATTYAMHRGWQSLGDFISGAALLCQKGEIT